MSSDVEIAIDLFKIVFIGGIIIIIFWKIVKGVEGGLSGVIKR